MKCHNDLISFYTSIGVNLWAPPQVNIKLGFLCGCESPTQARKAYHQTHESPTQNTRGISPNERDNLVPTTIPTCLAPRPRETTFPRLQKSTLPYPQENYITIIQHWIEESCSASCQPWKEFYVLHHFHEHISNVNFLNMEIPTYLYVVLHIALFWFINKQKARALDVHKELGWLHWLSDFT
jgi:hypothetical protein